MSPTEPERIEWSDSDGAGVEPAIRLHRTPCTGGSPLRRVLLLHGLANSATVWNAVLRGWPEDVEVWAADLPWRSGCDSSWSLRGECSWWLRETVGLVPGGVDLIVAHSLSANVLLDALSGGVLGSRGEDAGILFVAPFFRPHSENFEWEAVAKSLENFERTIEDGIRLHAGTRMPADRVRDVARLVCQQIGPYGWATFFNLYLNTPWLRTELITAPSRVLVGELDGTARPWDGYRLAESLPAGSVRSIAGCGHFPMIERPAEFLAVANRFLHELSTGRPVPASGTTIRSGVSG